MEPTESVQRLGQNIEARHASVLKCDLVSSTMTKRQLDLDGQVAFQRAFEKIITDAVTRFGAHINQFEGDGALIIVGFPNPAEDSAELAVKTGLELVRVIEKADILPGVQLHLRVGIASGQVAIVKPSLAGGGDIFTGTVIDLSERLRALAAPGQVVIDDPTKRLAGGFFDYDNLGKVTIKGFDRDVQAWRVLGQSNAASRFEAQRWDASRPNIIGRSEALESLSEAWKSSLGGHGQVVCLVGEAGIGKSRLARAVLDQAAQDGARTLEIDWMPSTGNSTQ
jgi:class 3 adenylate cyclase